MSDSVTSQSAPGHLFHPLQLTVIIPQRLSLSHSHTNTHTHTHQHQTHTDQWIWDNYKFLHLAAVQFKAHSDHVISVSQWQKCILDFLRWLCIRVSWCFTFYIAIAFFFFCNFISRRDKISTLFFCGWKKKHSVLLSFLLSAEIILHRCQLQRISFWVKRRKMCSAIAAVTSGLYSQSEKTSLCVYLSPGPRISHAGSFAASAQRPICCRSARAAGRREARERSQTTDKCDCVILTLCLVRLEMFPAIAWSQSKQSSAVGNCMTPLQTPSTAMTWKAFFLKVSGEEKRSWAAKLFSPVTADEKWFGHRLVVANNQQRIMCCFQHVFTYLSIYSEVQF